ncbi:MAG: YncE family protein [Bryobacteraceae bacterium]
MTLAAAAVPRAAAETLNQSVVATIAVGTNPEAIVANPVTNKIYVANQGSNTVTVIDGLTNSTSTIAVGAAPLALAINTVTNKIYVVNSGSANVTAIDGATGSTSTIATASGGRAVAVNSATNQIFVVSPAVVTEIDGATGNTSSIASEGALGIAVDMANNRLYTCGFLGIQVIDVASQSVVATIPIAGNPPSLAIVNPAMHQVYFGTPNINVFDVLDTDTNQLITPSGLGVGGGGTLALNPSTNQLVLANKSVTLYDAPTNTETLLGSLGFPWNISAINPVTNQVYLAANNTVAVLDGGNNYAFATTLSTGGSPSAIAVNPLTDLVYVANSGTNNVTVVSGASNVTTLFNNAQSFAVDVNPLTNKGYIANTAGNTLLVIDGETNAVTSVPVGQGPDGTLVNARSNKIYTLNSISGSITAVDGVTLATTNVPTGESPFAGVINPLTDKVYAGNSDGSVTVLDGATNSVTNLNVAGPNNDLSAPGMAVNPVTNQVYLVDPANSALKVVNGATNAVTSYPVGASPEAVAVNPITNLVYVANSNGNSVTVIDAATGGISAVQLPFSPTLVAVNPYTNLIYAAGPENTQLAVAVIDGVTNQPTINSYPVAPNFFGMLSVDTVTNRIYVAQSTNLTVAIDGATNALLLPSQPATGQLEAIALAIDPVHERVYGVSNTTSGVLVEEPSQSSPLTVTIEGLTGNQTLSPTPTIMLTAVDGLTPGSPPVENVYYRFDTLAGPQSVALRNADGSFTAAPAAPLQPGFHVLVAWATNGRENTVSSSNFFNGDSPLISPVARYGFYVVPAASITITTQGPSYQLFVGGTEQLLATATLVDGSSIDVTNTASWSSSIPQDAMVSAGLVSGLSGGSVSISAAIDGLTASTEIPVMPATYQLNVVPSISKDAKGDYVVQIGLTNQGDVNLSNVALTSALLNKTAGPLPAPIPSLAVGASANLRIVFPSSAGVPKSTALLKLSGRYSGVIPGGTPQKGTFSANFRIVLP